MTDSTIVKAFEAVARALRACPSVIPTDELEDVIRKLKQPRCREAEGDSKDADIADVIHGASFLSHKDDAVEWAASKAWKKGYYAGRSQPIDGFYRDGVHRKDCPCAECNKFQEQLNAWINPQPTPPPDRNEQMTEHAQGCGVHYRKFDGFKGAPCTCKPPPASDEEEAEAIASVVFRVSGLGNQATRNECARRGIARGRELGRAEVLEKLFGEPNLLAFTSNRGGHYTPKGLRRLLRDFVEQLKRGGE